MNVVQIRTGMVGTLSLTRANIMESFGNVAMCVQRCGQFLAAQVPSTLFPDQSTIINRRAEALHPSSRNTERWIVKKTSKHALSAEQDKY